MAFTLPLSTMRPVAIPGTILSRNCKLRRTKMKDEKREREKAFRMANSSWKTRIVRRSNYRMNEFGRGENSLHLPFHGNLNSLLDDGGGEEKKEEEEEKKKDGGRMGIERFPSRTRFQLIPRSRVFRMIARDWQVMVDRRNCRNVEIIL